MLRCTAASRLAKRPAHRSVVIWRCVPLERARRHGRVFANAQDSRSLVLLLEVSPSQRGQLLAVFLLDGAPFAVELLYFVEPGNAVGQPGGGGLEAILEQELG